MILIVMGVSGAGKTLIGKLLAERLGCDFFDGDAFHSKANKQKMAGGIALTDADRWPWLATIHEVIAEKLRRGNTAVFSCSALKRAYREVLRGDAPAAQVRFVYLQGSFDVLQSRLSGRSGHFFNASLLQTQLDTLEEPNTDEALIVNIELAPREIVERVLANLQ